MGDLKGGTRFAFVQYSATSGRLGGTPNHFLKPVLFLLSMASAVHELISQMS